MQRLNKNTQKVQKMFSSDSSEKIHFENNKLYAKEDV